MTHQEIYHFIFLPTVFLGIGTLFILLPLYLTKKINARILQPISKTFHGRLSLFYWLYTGNYKDYKFTISFRHGNPNICKVKLLLNSEINFDAYIRGIYPGPVLFKKMLQSLPCTEDGPYIFSRQPEKARYFMQDESNLKFIREIMELPITESALKWLCKYQYNSAESAEKWLHEIQQNLGVFIFKKNKLITNIVIGGGSREPIDPQLVQLCLDKMIMLAENLRTAPRF
jgi:hypothetical protein